MGSLAIRPMTIALSAPTSMMSPIRLRAMFLLVAATSARTISMIASTISSTVFAFSVAPESKSCTATISAMRPALRVRRSEASREAAEEPPRLAGYITDRPILSAMPPPNESRYFYIV